MIIFLLRHRRLFTALRIIAAASCAVVAALLLKLDFAISAGIVAILSVAPTKHETVKTALSRFLAFISAVAVAFVCFAALGCSTVGFVCYLIVFIPLCLYMGWTSAMAMDSVLISHFLSSGGISTSALANEALIFITGAGFGILVNLLLRQDTASTERLKNETDALIKTALNRMAERIENPGMPDYDGKCIARMYAAVDSAEVAARNNLMNALTAGDMTDLKYTAMRRRQIDILEEMYHTASRIEAVPATAKPVADFLRRTAAEYERSNTADSLLNALNELQLYMDEAPLPQTRGEFEARARLFCLMQSMELFLEIKRDYMREQIKR